MPASTVRVELPFPISVNAMYRVFKGRPVLSPRYRAWKLEAGLKLNVQAKTRIVGPVNVRLALVAPDRRKRDADNLAKCVLDLLVTHGIIEADDSRIVQWVHPEWVEEGPACLVTITAAERQEWMAGAAERLIPRLSKGQVA